MRAFIIGCSLLLAAAFGSAAEHPCSIGSKLGKDGKVAEGRTTFGAKDPIHMTVLAPAKHKEKAITLVVDDARGEEMKTIWGDLKKRDFVTFPIRNLEPGRYTATATIDKKQICKLTFEIR